jgi:hypothetical protein
LTFLKKTFYFNLSIDISKSSNKEFEMEVFFHHISFVLYHFYGQKVNTKVFWLIYFLIPPKNCVGSQLCKFSRGLCRCPNIKLYTDSESWNLDLSFSKKNGHFFAHFSLVY